MKPKLDSLLLTLYRNKYIKVMIYFLYVLLIYVYCLQYIKREWSIERKALLNVNSVAEKLVTRCMASIPENEGPSEAIKNDTATIAKTVETIQDR